MYSDDLVDIRVSQANDLFHDVLPGGLIEYSIPEVEAFGARLSTVFDQNGRQLRPFAADELRFIRNEQTLGKLSWRYWAERYATISIAAQAIAPMFPLWESQTLILDRIGQLQWERYESNHPDGV